MNPGTLARRQQSWLQAYPKSGTTLVLYRMERLLALLGHPERDLPARIQIVGTNGKGSTTALIQSIFQAAGYRAGAFFSPAFVSESEKIRLGGSYLSQEIFEEQIRLLEPVAKRLESELGEKPTRFELITALAVLLFRHWRVDVALFEAGLGGRYDSTSALGCPLVALTNVSLDHTRILGDTIHAIASDKVHAVREGTRAAVTTFEGEALGLLEDRCCSFQVPLSEPSLAFCRDLSFNGTTCNIRTPFHAYERIQTNLIGLHQVRNLALALRATEEASRLFSLSVSERALRRGCQEALHPGRLQVVPPTAFESLQQKPPHILLDGAHNPAGMRALLATLLAISPERTPIAVYATKNLLPDALHTLLKRCERVYLPPIDIAPHFQRPARLLRFLSPSARSRVVVSHSLEEAIYEALQQGAQEQRDVLFTGSLYFLGALYARYPHLFPSVYQEAELPLLPTLPLSS